MATEVPSSDDSPLPVAKRERKPNIRLGDLGDSKPSKRSKPHRPRPRRSSPDPATTENQTESPDPDSKRSKRPRAKPSTDNSGPENQRESSDTQARVRVSDNNREPSPVVDMRESGGADDLATEDNHLVNQNVGASLVENGGVHGWLDRLGLSRYRPLFDIHEVDEAVLPLLTLEDLRDMGISAVGSRRKLYCALEELKKGL
ncbi:hypothetical protein LUZ63_016967 [Rhynchospora breviuscula]|uniref:SAM domain-containing protein n=1 Tax=Rhynchospora breviuscula TaxID=2022672 RepID=A0A9Q0C1L5_9POAL|nr:hypothetical protein LUZ63_016967 [Rhynchospora breviuscula]